MENSLKIFENSEFGEVRAHIESDGGIWFVAKDVCDVLEIKNSSDAISKLDDDEKGVVLTDPLSVGGRQEMAVISEGGFYRLVMRSDKPKAKPFQKWVTSEVLPAIRKQGFYIKGHVSEETLKSIKEDLKKYRKKARVLENKIEALEYAKYLSGENVAIERLEWVAKIIHSALHSLADNNLTSVHNCLLMIETHNTVALGEIVRLMKKKRS